MSELKFLCDEMLRGVARWMRAAGYDTTVADTGSDDRALLRQAKDESRWFLTRDRVLSNNNQPTYVIVLLQNSTELCLRELAQKLPIDFHFKPFSRCMLCNTPVVSATAEQLAAVPHDVVANNQPIFYCPNCQKLYWEGSHVKRIRATLDRLSRAKLDSKIQV